MITQDALTIIADKTIPEGTHKLLRVNSREAWVKIVSKMIEEGYVEPNPQNLRSMSKNWEFILISTLSLLN